MRKRQVLMISYYWPPAGGPGVQRVLKFVKYLPEFGWDPIILTVEDGEYQAIDKSLESDISVTLKVFKTRVIGFYGFFKKLTGRKTIPTFQLSGGENESLFSRVGRWIRLNLILPDGRIGWYPFAVVQGREIIENEKIDLIFSSGPPHSLHLIARSLAKKYHIPWVADFRDPWMERFYYHENKRWKISEKIDGILEKLIVNNVDRIVTVSAGLKDIFERKIDSSKIHVIYNGYDEADFASVKPCLDKNIATSINYIGSMSKTQYPRAFFQAVRELVDVDQHLPLILGFAGAIHPSIKLALKNKFKLNDHIRYHDYVSHTEAIELMVKANYLLLVVPNTADNKGIVTGKLFEYLRSGTPIILIGPPDSDPAKIVLKARAGFVFNYDQVNEIKSLITNLEKPKCGEIHEYSRKYLTGKLAEVFNGLELDNFEDKSTFAQ